MTSMRQQRILIGSPVCQKPHILNFFLRMLDGHRCESADIHYVFVNDNNNAVSGSLLHEFVRRRADRAVLLEHGVSDTSYHCDETTHYWNDQLVWKVAGHKNRMIDYALKHGFDALMLIDSDVLMRQGTIDRLLAADRMIISEIFWTRWRPDTPQLPQVWLRDEYDLNPIGAWKGAFGEAKTDRDVVQQLRTPGVYEVGGLGACTLIRRQALEAGVRFDPIRNISFWGEDRHFCIRAAALGFKLHVDTHFPAFHIYRESDLAEAVIFLKGLDSAASVTLGTMSAGAVEGGATTDRAASTSEAGHAPPSPVRKADVRPPAAARPKVTLSMVIHNEADKHLREMLLSHREYIDEAVIIDDGSTDGSGELALEALRGIPVRLIRNESASFANEAVLRKQQWSETVRSNPDWILNMDADEQFEPAFAPLIRDYLVCVKEDVVCFRLYDMWSATHYREDAYWRAHSVYRPFLVRYRPGMADAWNDQPLHCGRFPATVWHWPGHLSPYRVKHWGWSTPAIRQSKYERYLKLDPDARYGWKEQYNSILDADPNLIPW